METWYKYIDFKFEVKRWNFDKLILVSKFCKQLKI